MSLNHWAPMREVAELWEKYNRLFEKGVVADPAESPVSRLFSPEALAKWTPAADVIELDFAYLFRIEIPAVAMEDVQVNVVNKLLKVEGERKAESFETVIDMHRVERFHGRFARSFTLPGDAEEDEVTAELKDGLLSIWVNKVKGDGKTVVPITNMNQ